MPTPFTTFLSTVRSFSYSILTVCVLVFANSSLLLVTLFGFVLRCQPTHAHLPAQKEKEKKEDERYFIPHSSLPSLPHRVSLLQHTQPHHEITNTTHSFTDQLDQEQGSESPQATTPTNSQHTKHKPHSKWLVSHLSPFSAPLLCPLTPATCTTTPTRPVPWRRPVLLATLSPLSLTVSRFPGSRRATTTPARLPAPPLPLPRPSLPLPPSPT